MDGPVRSAAGLWPSERGPRPAQDPANIVLEECLVHFAEGVACGTDMANLQSPEPAQQGAGSPDGTAVLVSLLRKWATLGAAQEWASPLGKG